MMPRLRQILSAALLCAALPALPASPVPTRTVAAKANANVRAKPSVSSEILFSSKKGQPLQVVRENEDPKAASDEPKRWAEVVVPAGTRVWVYGALIDPATKVVRANTVNLRAGPGRNYSDVGSIPRGTPVKELRATDGWLEIEAPEGTAHGFVAATLLGEEIHPETVAAVPEPPRAVMAPPAPRSGSRPVPLPSNNSRPAPSVGRAAPADSVVTAQPLAPARRAEPPTIVIEPIPAEIVPPPAPVANQPVPEPVAPAVIAPAVVAPPALPAVITQVSQPEIVLTEKVREVQREGIVDFVHSPQAPGDYQLNNFRKGEAMVGFLYTEDKNIHFNEWRWKRVLITGEEYIDPNWPRRPLIKVTAIRDAY